MTAANHEAIGCKGRPVQRYERLDVANRRLSSLADPRRGNKTEAAREEQSQQSIYLLLQRLRNRSYWARWTRHACRLLAIMRKRHWKVLGECYQNNERWSKSMVYQCIISVVECENLEIMIDAPYLPCLSQSRMQGSTPQSAVYRTCLLSAPIHALHFRKR